MDGILNFLENNYIWFLVAAVVLLFALVGFIVDSKRKQKKMEGNFENKSEDIQTNMEQSHLEETPMTTESVAPEVQAPEENVNTPITEEVKAPFIEEPTSPEILDIESNSNNMTFNDIPEPQVQEAPHVEEPIKEEIIEPFNLGSPVQASTSNAVVNEPVISPTMTTEQVSNVDTEQEPVVKINE